MIGRIVSHYEILEKLGAGGMGIVYKARDTRLGRTVALKFLPPQLGDDEMRQRFLQEARAASNLDHPSICTIHDIDEAPDVGPFIVMGYYAGETLREKLRDGALPAQVAISWARQIVAGLVAAHAEDVVHRDIKPANILITDRDEVKILDFGLAKVLGATQVTRTGTTLGTLGYMSPEQLAGGEIDQRTDIWSFGVLLVEMLTGRAPFAGNTEGAVVNNILHREIPVPSKLREELPPRLDRIVERCLARQIGERYGTARQLATELEGLARPSSEHPTSLPPDPAMPDPAMEEDPTLPAVRAVEQDEPEALAVLDFLNYSGDADTDWLSSGIAESVTVDSKKLVPIPVVARGKVAQAVAARDDVPRNETAARELGDALGARWVVWGGFQRAGEALRITAHFLDTTKNEPVGSVKLDGTMSEIFALQDRIIESLADSLDVALSDSGQRRVGGPRTTDLEAFEYCARGRQLIWQLDPSDFDEAKVSLEKAIEIDPSYALAFSGLGQLYSMRFITSTDRGDLDRAIENLQKATELDAELADPHLWLAYDYARLGRFEDAISHGRRAVELDAEESMGHYFLGVAYWLQAQIEHRSRARIEALRHMLRTVELAPRDQPAHQVVGDLYLQLGLYEQAEPFYRRAVDIEDSGDFQNARFVGSYSGLGLLFLHRGELEPAEEWLERGRQSLASAEHVYAEALLAVTLCGLGELALRRSRFDVALGHYGDAARVADRSPRALGIGWFRILASIGQARAFHRLAMRVESRAALEAAQKLLEEPREAYDFSGIWNGGDAAVYYELASLRAFAMQSDAAIEALEKAAECGWRELPRLERDPAFRDLRADPAFERLRAEVERDLTSIREDLPKI